MTIKLKMKAVLFAAMFATAGFASQAVQAATFPSSQLITNPFDGSLSGTFGDTFYGVVGGFEDRFTFSVGSGYEGSASVTSTFTKASSDLTITGFNLVRYSGLESNVLSTITGVNKTGTATGGTLPDDNWTIASQGLAAGSYYVQILGTVNYAALVSYSGVLTVLPSVTAVPEPETYGMMLGGLALLGVVARRKAAKKAA